MTVTANPDTFYPVLRACRSEIAEAIRNSEHNSEIESDAEKLAAALESAEEHYIEQIARKVGDLMMDGGDYWGALPLAAESVLGVQN
jgi:hypothetical protein